MTVFIEQVERTQRTHLNSPDFVNAPEDGMTGFAAFDDAQPVHDAAFVLGDPSAE